MHDSQAPISRRSAACEVLERHLCQRCRRYPQAARPGGVDALAALLSEAGWDLPIMSLLALADLALGIHAFEELVAHRRIPDDELVVRAEQLAACARGNLAELACDPTAQLVSTVARRLAASPPASRLRAEWDRIAGETFAAIAARRRHTGHKRAALTLAAAILAGDAAMAARFGERLDGALLDGIPRRAIVG
jgi:hypothetical protein